MCRSQCGKHVPGPHRAHRGGAGAGAVNRRGQSAGNGRFQAVRRRRRFREKVAPCREVSGGGDRSRTGDGGFADLCLTTWLRRPAKQAYQARPEDDRARRRRPPPRPEGGLERVKGLEPSTFCMASRRSSRLSYTRSEWGCYQRAPGGAIRRFAGDRPAACPRISAWRRRSPD